MLYRAGPIRIRDTLALTEIGELWYGPWQSRRATSSRRLDDQIERLGPTSARNLHLAARVQKLAMFADGGMKATGRGQSIRGNAKFSSAARRDGKCRIGADPGDWGYTKFSAQAAGSPGTAALIERLIDPSDKPWSGSVQATIVRLD